MNAEEINKADGIVRGYIGTSGNNFTQAILELNKLIRYIHELERGLDQSKQDYKDHTEVLGNKINDYIEYLKQDRETILYLKKVLVAISNYCVIGRKEMEGLSEHALKQEYSTEASEYYNGSSSVFNAIHVVVQDIIGGITPHYKDDLSDIGDLFTVEDFKRDCERGCLIDYDGFGHPVKDNKMAGDVTIRPSMRDVIPMDATHIMWFNK